MRVAGDGGHGADVGGRGQGQQVGDGVAAQAEGEFDDEGGEYQDDGVIQKEGGKQAGGDNDEGQEEAG